MTSAAPEPHGVDEVVRAPAQVDAALIEVASGEVLARPSGALVRVTPHMHKALGLLRRVLVVAAREGRVLTYEQASAATGAAYLPRGMGPLLDVVRTDCERRGEPPLAALVVRKDSGSVGDGYGGDAIAERAACFAHWGKGGHSAAAPRPLQHLSTTQLLAGYAATLAELRSRGVVRSANAPAGDYGEWLVARAFDVPLESNSTKSYDLQLAGGSRVQVKTRLVSDPPRSGQLQTSVFRSWDFELAALVLLRDSDYRVLRAALLPSAVLQTRARRSDHVNGASVQMTDEVFHHNAAENITAELQTIQDARHG